MEHRACPLCGQRSQRRMFDYAGRIGDETTTYIILRCAACQLIMVDPLPTQDELRRFYGSADYLAPYADHARWKAWNARHHFQRKLDLIERFVGRGRLLDVGTGDGLFPHLAAGRGWDAYGLDISTNSIGYAREVHNDVTMIEGQLGDPALAGLALDAITFIHNLEHYGDPGEPLRLAHQMLREGGVVLVAAPVLDAQVEKFVGFLPVGRRLRTGLLRMVGSAYPPNHLVVFSTATLCAFLKRAGFTPVQISYTSKVRPLFMVGWKEWLVQEALRPALTLLRSGMHVEVLARKG